MNRDDAAVTWFIAESKVLNYLLDLKHPHGASKAKYLIGFGFSAEAPKRLADALVAHALANLPGTLKIQDTGPDRIVFEGTVPAPDGRAMPLRTVWEIGDAGEMRFLTAIPLTR